MSEMKDRKQAEQKNKTEKKRFSEDQSIRQKNTRESR